MGDVLSIATSLIAGSIRVSIPIAFAALGGTLSERSGIINMGLEGTMLMGAFLSVRIIRRMSGLACWWRCWPVRWWDCCTAC